MEWENPGIPYTYCLVAQVFPLLRRKQHRRHGNPPLVNSHQIYLLCNGDVIQWLLYMHIMSVHSDR